MRAFTFFAVVFFGLSNSTVLNAFSQNGPPSEATTQQGAPTKTSGGSQPVTPGSKNPPNPIGGIMGWISGGISDIFGMGTKPFARRTAPITSNGVPLSAIDAAASPTTAAPTVTAVATRRPFTSPPTTTRRPTTTTTRPRPPSLLEGCLCWGKMNQAARKNCICWPGPKGAELHACFQIFGMPMCIPLGIEA